jgi:hypothetical protein
MVAYTTDYCLPYFEGTDSPCLNTGTVCDPSTVWCDFTQIVADAIEGFDMIINRTADAIPLATVAYLPDTPTAIISDIPFDTVIVDTDNMVDLNTFQGITPSRNGVYLITSRVHVADPAANLLVSYWTTVGSETTPGDGATEPTLATGEIRGGGTGGFRTLSSSTYWQFTGTEPIPRTVNLSNGEDLSTVLTSAAYLTVAWHSEID